ncbi:MAG: tyrosine-type recombinase/integrase [Planctomycetes bacterium]|nr:tyrosine-type recombinase/integrase [Planctomycetota bacterium]
MAKSRVTWADFRDAYEQHVTDNLSDSTLNRVSGVFNQFERVIAPDRLASIGKEQLQQFADAMKSAGRSIETIRSHSRHLAVAFNWAVKNKMLPVGPEPAEITYKVNGKRIKREKSGGRPLAGEEFERMILAVSGTLYRTPDREPDPMVVSSWQRLLRGLWWSGLRISEAHYLTWDDDRKPCVDFSGKRPMLWIPAEYSKSGEDAECPMAPEFAEMLTSVAEDQRTGFIFNPRPLRYDNRPQLDSVKRKIADFGRRANVKVKDLDNGKVKFASAHDLRRSFGFRWSQRVMPAVLKQLMRHKTIQTTMEYYATQRAQETADAVWGAFANTLPTPDDIGIPDSSQTP